MTDAHSELSGEHRRGDKIHVRRGLVAGQRGIIRGAMDDLLDIELNRGQRVSIAPDDLTNYSLAARRAWRTRPKRAGRPPAAGLPKKMVSIRIDVDVWNGLAIAAERGLIRSREQAVNQWLRQKLGELSEPGDASVGGGGDAEYDR